MVLPIAVSEDDWTEPCQISQTIIARAGLVRVSSGGSSYSLGPPSSSKLLQFTRAELSVPVWSAARLPQLIAVFPRFSDASHTIRHTTAVHLLRAGVDINTIRAWLGHVSLDTTNIYAEVDLEMKAKALAHCEILSEVKEIRTWNTNPDLMAFLRSL